MSTESNRKAEIFLAIASQFKLGSLITESQHPDTKNLSYQATNDLPAAISSLKNLDNTTLSILYSKIKEIDYLKNAISVVRKNRLMKRLKQEIMSISAVAALQEGFRLQ